MATIAQPITAAFTSLRGAADYLGCSVDHVQRMVASGRIPASRVGEKIIRIRLSDIEDYLQHNRVQ
jgi:excisionase family DNA binding protein